MVNHIKSSYGAGTQGEKDTNESIERMADPEIFTFVVYVSVKIYVPTPAAEYRGPKLTRLREKSEARQEINSSLMEKVGGM